MERFTFFWHGPFSQWEYSEFEVDGVKYYTAEQYMMAQKAILFDDADILQQIMNTKEPQIQKRFGRKVKNFDVTKWNAVARNVVYDGNYAKFSQNKNLREHLFSTQGTTLVEASPFDKIWGIGLRATDERAKSRETWNGTNWLGEVLTKVRDDLIVQEQS